VQCRCNPAGIAFFQRARLRSKAPGSAGDIYKGRRETAHFVDRPRPHNEALGGKTAQG